MECASHHLLSALYSHPSGERIRIHTLKRMRMQQPVRNYLCLAEVRSPFNGEDHMRGQSPKIEQLGESYLHM